MLELIRDIGSFILARKKVWMLPLILTLLLMGGLVVVTQGTAVAPFVYTLF